jgi:hypothetical protein
MNLSLLAEKIVMSLSLLAAPLGAGVPRRLPAGIRVTPHARRAQRARLGGGYSGRKSLRASAARTISDQ